MINPAPHTKTMGPRGSVGVNARLTDKPLDTLTLLVMHVDNGGESALFRTLGNGNAQAILK